MRLVLLAVAFSSTVTACAPIVLRPAGSLARANKTEAAYAIMPGYGLMRGTDAGLKSLAQPPVELAPGSVAELCRAALEREANGFAPARVDVVALRPDPAGAPRADMTVRVVYARTFAFEIRLANLSCRLDAAGRLAPPDVQS